MTTRKRGEAAPLKADKRNLSPKKMKKSKPVVRKSKNTKPLGLLYVIRRISLFPIRIIWALTWRLTIVVNILIVLGLAYFAINLPDSSALIDGRVKGSVTLLDRYGKVFAWRGDQFGGVITADSVSPFLKNAIVATEDKRFFNHLGLSPRGIASAIRINLRSGRGPLSGNGGSTITQQTAKLICLGEPYNKEIWKT